MPETLKITQEEILYQLKISGQLPKLIEGIITRQAIASFAQEAGITVAVEEVQQAADNFRLSRNLKQAKDTWQWLQERGLSLDEFEAMVEGMVLSDKVAHHLFAEEVERHFASRMLDYHQVIIYEIFLNDKDLARELFYIVQAGEEDFYTLAHKYNSDEQLRRTGGYRGLLRRQDLKPEVSAAVFAANPPQVLNPIETAKGIHLILVEEIVEPQLDEPLKQQILSDLWAGWLKQRVKETIGSVEVG